jgi:hypothetical protein
MTAQRYARVCLGRIRWPPQEISGEEAPSTGPAGPRPFGLFLPVGCWPGWPLCFAQKFLNAMSTTQLRGDTGISQFWVHPPVGRGAPAPVSNWLLFPVGCSPCGLRAVLARRSQNKTSFFYSPLATLCTCRFHSPRYALTPLEWAYCPYPIPVFITITFMPPITSVA